MTKTYDIHDVVNSSTPHHLYTTIDGSIQIRKSPMNETIFIVTAQRQGTFEAGGGYILTKCIEDRYHGDDLINKFSHLIFNLSYDHDRMAHYIEIMKSQINDQQNIIDNLTRMIRNPNKDLLRVDI